MDMFDEGDVMVVGVIKRRRGGFSVVRTDGEVLHFATEAAAYAANAHEAEFAEMESQGWGLAEEVACVA